MSKIPDFSNLDLDSGRTGGGVADWQSRFEAETGKTVRP